jgi:hypothetical protein
MQWGPNSSTYSDHSFACQCTDPNLYPSMPFPILQRQKTADKNMAFKEPKVIDDRNGK